MNRPTSILVGGMDENVLKIIQLNFPSSLRYGIFDEFGFAGDAVYPNYFRVGGNILPTGTSNEPVVGTWKNANDQESNNLSCAPIGQKFSS